MLEYVIFQFPQFGDFFSDLDPVFWLLRYKRNNAIIKYYGQFVTDRRLEGNYTVCLIPRFFVNGNILIEETKQFKPFRIRRLRTVIDVFAEINLS
jgi:hypothetical protein